MIRELFLEDLSLWSCVWQSTLFAAIGLVGSFLLRRRPAKASQILFLGIIAAVLVPAMSIAVKHFEWGLFTAEPSTMVPELPLEMNIGRYKPSIVASGPELDIRPMEPASIQTRTSSIKIPWRMIMLYAWLIATVILSWRLLVAIVNGVLLLRRAKPATVTYIQQSADTAKARLGITKQLQVRGSRNVRSPVIWCWNPNPVLVVPDNVDATIDWIGVISHELAHWRRLDHVSGLIAELAVCVLPWNPLLWLAKRLMVRFSEQACDDWVVAGGEPCEDYAQSLLNFKPQKQAAFVPAVVHSRKGVAARVRRILTESCVNPRTGTKWALTVSILTACIAIGIACAQTRPAKPETAKTEGQNKVAESLHRAAWNGDIEQVRLLISQGADVNAKDRNGSMPIHDATWGRHADVVELLIQKGADVDAKDGDGVYTSLYYAVWSGDTKITRILVTNGADLNYVPEGEWPPLYYMLWRNEKDLVELMVDNGSRAPAFHLAAFRGDLAKVKSIYAKGMDVDARDALDWTPLHWATSGGQMDIVEFLIGKGTDVRAKTKYKSTLLHLVATKELAELLLSKGLSVNETSGGSTPLHCAAKRGYVKVAEVIISHGAKIEAKNSGGRTPLHAATRYGKKKMVEFLITKGAAVNTIDNQGRTALSQAVARGYTDVVDLLRKHGAVESLHDVARVGDIERVKSLIAQYAGVNLRDKDGRVPLHKAAEGGHRDVVQLLLEEGADINVSSEDWLATPLHCAVGRGHTEVVELLLARGAILELRNPHGYTPLHLAARTNKLRIAELLLDKAADIEAMSNYYQTPLFQAAENGHIDMVRLLLAKGANLQATQVGLTVIGAAMTAHQKEMVKFLVDLDAKEPPVHLAAYFGQLKELGNHLENGADIDLKDPSGFTPLHCAVCGGQAGIVEFLISKGGNVNAKNAWQWTALHYASDMGRKDMVEILLAHGTDVNTREIVGRNALSLAAYKGHKDIVQLLYTKGADINVKHVNNYTPLQMAARNGHKDVVEFLLGKGADVNTLNHQGLTAFELAKQNDHTEIVELLRKHGAKE